MNRPILPLSVSVFFWVIGEALPALTPEQQRWREFILGHSVSASLPEDERLGPLANLRSPDPESEEAVRVCESVFTQLAEGILPSAHFHPAARTPLNFTFGALLDGGPRQSERRYGRPIRNGGTVTLPVRLEGGPVPSYGHVYLRLSQGVWYVDQWALDLSGLPPADLPSATAPPQTASENLENQEN